MPISIDREIKASKPDVVAEGHQSKACYITDVSTLSERNVALKEVEKLSSTQNTDLEIEIKGIWSMKICNLGMIRRTGKKWIKQPPGNPHLEMLQELPWWELRPQSKQCCSLEPTCQHLRSMDYIRCY